MYFGPPKKESPYEMKKIILLGAIAFASSASAHDVIHANHGVAHSSDDGHIAINHDGHIDHLHDGHLHSVHDGHVDEHVLSVSAAHPVAEKLVKQVKHTKHNHSSDDNDHPTIQHGDHFDYVHDGKLHHVHGDHVDNHGKLDIVS